MRPWTLAQRVAAAVLVAGIVSVGAVRLWGDRAYVPDPQPEHPLRESELADRIDPNTADAAALAALPLIGERKARDIIAYRERQRAKRPGEPAFSEVDDLLRIKGIGAATVQQLRRYLIFSAKPATSPDHP